MYTKQFLRSIFSNNKKLKSTPKYDYPFYLSKTNWQSQNGWHVYQQNRHQMQKSNISNDLTRFCQKKKSWKSKMVGWSTYIKDMYTNITKKKKMRKSNICNSRNFKISVSFSLHPVYIGVFPALQFILTVNYLRSCSRSQISANSRISFMQMLIR